MSLYLSWSIVHLLVVVLGVTFLIVMKNRTFRANAWWNRSWKELIVCYIAILFLAVDNGVHSSKIDRAAFDTPVETKEISKVEVENRRDSVRQNFKTVVEEKGDVQ